MTSSMARGERAFQGASRGVAVAAAAESLRNLCHVDFALAAQAQADVAFGQLAQEDCDFNAGDADGDVDDALAVFVAGAGADHVLMGDPEQSDAALALEVVESRSEQQDLGGGRGVHDFSGNVDRVSPGQNEFVRNLEGGGADCAVGKAARVREQGGVEAGGHFSGDGGSGSLDQAVHQLADAGRVEVNPVEVGEGSTADVVIDVDEEEVFKSA